MRFDKCFDTSLAVRSRVLHHPTYGHAGELHLLEMHLGIRHPFLCMGEFVSHPRHIT
jgi:hypothetical protein